MQEMQQEVCAQGDWGQKSTPLKQCVIQLGRLVKGSPVISDDIRPGEMKGFRTVEGLWNNKGAIPALLNPAPYRKPASGPNHTQANVCKCLATCFPYLDKKSDKFSEISCGHCKWFVPYRARLVRCKELLRHHFPEGLFPVK